MQLHEILYAEIDVCFVLEKWVKTGAKVCKLDWSTDAD